MQKLEKISFPEVQLVKTEDGSKSLYVESLQEQYHSKFGAITESMHIYIEKGFRAIKLPSFSIFEIGFGTGLNAYLSLLEAENKGKSVKYTSIDLYPVDNEVIKMLDYPSRLQEPSQDKFLRMHDANWNQEVEIVPGFRLTKVHQDFRKYKFDIKYDLVYYDAFAPTVQPEMWTQNRIDAISRAMNPGAILVTYSAMGEVRRRLALAGLRVNRLPGPPGKREILQALKP